MYIHVVEPNDTVFSIAAVYGVPPSRLVYDNQLSSPDSLVIGQALLILIPKTTYSVRSGDTLESIAGNYNVRVIDLLRNNPYLAVYPYLPAGQGIIIQYESEPSFPMQIGGYAYPYINQTILAETLPYLKELLLFSYGFTLEGELVPIEDEPLIAMALQFCVDPILVLTPSDVSGTFNSAFVHAVVTDPVLEENLIQNLLSTVREKKYAGVDIDFEYIAAEDRDGYTAFVGKVTEAMNAEGYRVSVALAPKESANQPGLLYEGMDYRGLGEAANHVLLMTYEWGYTYGPPMAVAPLNKVQQIIEYAVTEIPPYKISLGIPNYGYDWPLPYERGVTRARSIGNVEAVQIAVQNNVQIQFDEIAKSPFFEYTAPDGIAHVVWFEDVRSIQEKLLSVPKYDLAGVGYWNLMKPFRANWFLANEMAVLPVKAGCQIRI